MPYIVQYTQPTHGFRDANTGRFVAPANDANTPKETKKILSGHFAEPMFFDTYKQAEDAMNERINMALATNEGVARGEHRRAQENPELSSITLEQWTEEVNKLYPVPTNPVIYKVEVATK